MGLQGLGFKGVDRAGATLVWEETQQLLRDSDLLKLEVSLGRRDKSPKLLHLYLPVKTEGRGRRGGTEAGMVLLAAKAQVVVEGRLWQ